MPVRTPLPVAGHGDDVAGAVIFLASDLSRNGVDEKLDCDYDDYRDLYRGSFEEIIARICRDLGIDGIEPPPELGEKPAFEAPLDTPIGKRLHIQAAIDRLQSLQGTGPP